MVSSGMIEIEKFNGQSFELWKLKMEDLLVDKDQWITVDPGTKPTRVTDEEWKKLDRKAKSTNTIVCLRFSIVECIRGSYGEGFMGQFDEIVSALLTEEMRRKNMDNQNGDALSVVCWKCGKEGHFRRSVKYKAPDKGKGSDDAPSVEAETTSDKGVDVYLASSSTHVDHEAWLIDSGASFHFTPHREWFYEYEKYDGGDVCLGDDRKARIIGRGKVKLKLQGRRVRTLPGVLHIPALARSMISLSKLDDADVKTVFKKDTYKMVREALVLMWGVRIGTLYKLQGSTVVDGCNSSMVPDNGAENLVVSGEKTMLWHQRLGHLGEKGLRILHGKGMVEGMSNSSLDFDFCENCVYGKQNRMTSQRNTWIYFHKKKSEVFDRFKEFKALVENQTEKKIKVLRTDNGGEFCSKEFEEFCKECGIARQKTTPYTPQQNGVAKRMNKTLMERARSMLSGAGLGQEFWAEAVDTACYFGMYKYVL
eukprot:PITA_34023